MAMANSVKTVSFTNTSDYLIAPELAFALSCIIGNTGVTANTSGRKIIKAGTPLYIATGKSVLEDRTEVLTVSSANSAVLSGIARHDIDVTDGDVNDAILIAGYVDLYRLDSAVQTALTSAIKAALTDIKFIKGAK